MIGEFVLSLITTNAVFRKGVAWLAAIIIVDHQAKFRSHQDVQSAIVCSYPTISSRPRRSGFTEWKGNLPPQDVRRGATSSHDKEILAYDDA